MSDFDLNAYLARRIPETSSASTKLQDLARASEEKAQFLQQYAVTTEPLREQARQATAASWVGQLGLDPEGVAGTLANLGASAAEGGLRIVNNIGSSIHAARAGAELSGIPDNVKEAYSRYTKGQASRDDLTLLALPAGDAAPNTPLTPYQKIARAQAEQQGKLQTNLERLRAGQYALADTQAMQDFDEKAIKPITERTRQNAQQADLRAGFKENLAKVTDGNVLDKVSGVAGMVTDIGKAAVEHPVASLELIANNAPQLGLAAGGAAGMALTNLPYAADEFGKGLTAYPAQHDGKLPTNTDIAKLAGQAASLALAETLGDKAVLGAGKLVPEAAKDVARTGFKKALLNNALGRTVAAGAEGATGEFLTEAYQTGMENAIEGKPVTAEDVYVGGAMGAIAGAGMSGGMHGAAELAGATPEKQKEKVQKLTEQAVKQQAIATGDVTPYLNPESKVYAPSKAVEALMGNAVQAEVTPEQAQAKHAEATKIVADLQEKRDVLADIIERSSPQGRAKLEAQLATQRQLIAAEADPAKRAGMEELATMLEQDLAAPAPDAKKLSASTAQLKQLDAQLQAAQHALNGFTTEQTSRINVADELQAAQSQPEAADRLIRLAMTAPARLSTEQVDTLLASPSLSEPQRSFLRAFSQARIEENRLKDAGGVSREIYTGSGPQSPRNYVGIAQYRQQVTQAIAADNQDLAIKKLAGLTAFAQDHANKAAAAEAGIAQGFGTQIVKNKVTGAWDIVPKGTYTDAQIKINGGHTLNSPAMVQNFRTEATALAAAQAELRAAMALHFKSETQNNQGEANVQDVPAAQDELPSRGTEPQAATSAAPAKEAQDRAVTGQAGSEGTNQQVKEQPTEPQATAVKAQPEQAGAVATAENTQDAQTDAAPDSRLDVFSEASPEGTPFVERKNVFADFFRQIIHRTDAKAQRPLASMKNFLSAWDKEGLDVGRFIPGGVHYPEQRAALQDLQERLLAWVPAIQKNLLKDTATRAEFRTQDMLQYLIQEADGKPVVEENVATAIAYAMYDWVLEAARQPDLQTTEDVNRMFGRDKDAFIPPKYRRELQSLRNSEFITVNDLGRVAVQALGIKPKKNAPKNLMPLLQQAFGVHALAQLEALGFIERPGYSAQQLTQMLTGVVDDTLSKRKSTFIRLPQTKDLRIDPKTKSLLADVQRANSGSMAVVDKLFGIEKAPRFATTQPVAFAQRFAQGTRQKISKLQRKVIEATMTIPHTAIPEMLAVNAGLGKEAFLRIAGVKDLASVHDVNASGVEAQNKNLELQYDLMWEMLDNPDNPEGYDTQFFVQQSVWKNFRAGFTTQSLNQQTSKIHRYMFARPNWTAKIDPANPQQVEMLQLALATNFGLKVENQPLAETIKAWEDKLAKQPEIMQAVQMMAAKEELDQPWSTAERELVTDIAVKHEGMMTLQALTAMMKFEQAKKTGKPAEITMLVGADGKTNGPMLTHLALGAAATADDLYQVLNQGGMYSVDAGQPTSYGDYYARPQSLDLYEGLGAKIIDAARQRMKPQAVLDKLPADKAAELFTPEAWDAFEKLVGTLRNKDGSVSSAGRNLTKTPLTAFGFGSSLSNSVKGMENAFIEGLYSTMEKIAAGDGKISAEGFIEALNELMRFGNPGVTRMTDAAATNLLRTEFTAEQEAALRGAFQRVMGNAVEDAMHEHFDTFIRRRGDLNKTIQGAFAAYHAVYGALREQELAKSEGVARRTNSKGQEVPLHDLSQEQEDALQQRVAKLLPVMHTDYSLREGNLEAGLYMAQETNGKSEDSLYGAKVALATKIANSRNEMNNFLSSQAQVTQEVSPGVAGVAYAIHSSDSAGIHKAMDKVPQSMNVHDEIGNGVTQIAKAASAINAATVDTFLEYSPAREAANMFERIVIQTAAELQAGTIDAKVVKQLFADWTATMNWGVPKKQRIQPEAAGQAMLTTTFANALAADTVRLEAIAKMAVMDQYPWHGGTFTVTEDIRKAAQAKLTELPSGPSPLLESAIRALEAAYAHANTTAGTATEVAADPAITMDPEAGSNPVQEYSGFWGPVGPSRTTAASDVGLVSWFEANPKATVRDVIGMLQGRLQEKTLQNTLYKQILAQLTKAAPLAMPVHYVTPTTDPALAVGGVEPAARGWTTSGVGIFVLGQQFAYSGLTTELLLHEMVHATLVDAIERPATAEARQLVENLKALQQQAIEAAKAKGLYTGNEAKLDNLHEFVAYGMTDTAFQEQVLKTLQVSRQAVKGNKLVDGMKAFIAAVTGLFFGSAKEAQTSALGLLIHNVSGLLAQAQSTQNQQESSDAQRYAMAAQVQSYSTQDIYTALEQQHNGAVSPSFSGKLKGLLSNIVEALHGPLGTFSQSLMTAPTLAPVDVWAQAKITGEAPFASLAIASGLSISEQEAFVAEQIEATVRAALDGSETQTKMAYRELAKLYAEAEQKLRGTSHAFLFDIPQHGNRSDYLARFAALGLAHEGFNTALQFATAERVAKQPATMADRLQQWVERALGWFQEKVLKTYGGQQADQKLEMLVRHLTGLEAQKRHTLLRQKLEFLAPVEAGVKKAMETAKAGATAALNTDFVRNHANPFIRATGTVGRTLVNGQVKFFMDGVQKVRNEMNDRRNGLAMSLIGEVFGTDEALQKVLRETKNNEGERKDIITHAAAAALDTFANNGKDLTDKQRTALGEVFLQTGAHNLLANTSMAEMEQLLSDPAALQAKIATIESQLRGTTHIQNYVKAHADAAAYFKVTGINTVDILRTNAHQIANLVGSNYAKHMSARVAEHNAPIIAQLIALYAFTHLPQQQRIDARSALSTENARTDGGHGVQFILQLHQHLEQESLQRLFNNNPMQMMHGHTPEIYNPYTELEVGDELPRFDSTGAVLPSTAQELRDRGYTQVAALAADPKDPNQHRRYAFLLKDGGLTPRITGAFSFTGMRAKGAKVRNALTVNTPTGITPGTQPTILQKAQQADAALFNQVGRRNLRQFNASRLAPIFDELGVVTGWRYMMQKRTRQLLDPDTRFDQLLGSLAGSVYDKEASRTQNWNVIELLHTMFNDPVNGFTSRSQDYLRIGPDAPEPELRELWALLPDATKQDVRAIWGEHGMFVKKDAVDILFGYRKYSLADMFDKDPAARNAAEQIAIHFAETFFGKQARTKVRTFERVWQELVKEAKDLIVIKTGTVMLGNIISNTWLLWQYGVPVKDMLHHQYVALKGATAYQEDMTALRRLKLQRDSGYLSGMALDQANRDIIKLEDSLDRNPVKELVDAGLMPTIVEDLGAEEDRYSYKSLAKKKLEGIGNAIPDGLKTIGKQVYMSHDTASYQMLSRITQLSDFVARYALYHHLIARQTDTLTKEEALQKASDAFINYDVPMHQGFQYLEDMGFLMFNKYFLRIQRVLGTLFKDKPGRMLATMAMKHFIGTGSTVLDSSMWHRIGHNPIMAGALQYPRSLDQLLTVHAAMKLIH